MAYKLSQLAPGSYDVVLNGVIIASLVRSDHTREPAWTAELLVDVPPEERPAPFTRAIAVQTEPIRHRYLLESALISSAN